VGGEVRVDDGTASAGRLNIAQRIMYQNGGFYPCLECITMVVSGLRDAVAVCGQ